MNNPLNGRVILVVEDELVIALDLACLFQSAGARVVQARSLRDAMLIADTEHVSAAVVDQGLADGFSTRLCLHLKERDIPFMIYSGYSTLEEDCSNAVLVEKPASSRVLLTTMISLLESGARHAASENDMGDQATLLVGGAAG